MKQSNSVLWVLKIRLENSSGKIVKILSPICIDTVLWSTCLVSFLLWCAGAPICINTVLWNTIKLLFPKHAANAPESPADAILTPSSANNTALVANAVAALPMRRIGLIHAPYNPPRSALLLTQAAAGCRGCFDNDGVDSTFPAALWAKYSVNPATSTYVVL